MEMVNKMDLKSKSGGKNCPFCEVTNLAYVKNECLIHLRSLLYLVNKNYSRQTTDEQTLKMLRPLNIGYGYIFRLRIMPILLMNLGEQFNRIKYIYNNYTHTNIC